MPEISYEMSWNKSRLGDSHFAKDRCLAAVKVRPATKQSGPPHGLAEKDASTSDIGSRRFGVGYFHEAR